MALRIFKCPLCGYIRETLRKRIPKCNHNQDEEGTPIPLKEMEEVLQAPTAKFMEPANLATGKSKIKDQNKTFLARARNHSRNVDIDDTIAINKDNEFGVSNNLLNEKGQRRKKIDDI